MERDKEKIRVVIDANILISALIKDDSITSKIINLEFLRYTILKMACLSLKSTGII